MDVNGARRVVSIGVFLIMAVIWRSPLHRPVSNSIKRKGKEKPEDAPKPGLGIMDLTTGKVESLEQ